jgi:hypothetical protein
MEQLNKNSMYDVHYMGAFVRTMDYDEFADFLNRKDIDPTWCEYRENEFKVRLQYEPSYQYQ